MLRPFVIWAGTAFSVGWLTLVSAAALAPPGAVKAEDALFFETRVRPVLAAHCFSCHGEKVQQAGIRLDSRAGLLRGDAKRRPVVVGGMPEQSSLIRAISHAGAVKMPPQGKLPAAAMADLTEWVRRGAPWPTQAVATRQDAKIHWAFRPLSRPKIPVIITGGSPIATNPIDDFINSARRGKRLGQNPDARRRTLIRRLYFDLVGLPPAPEVVEAFVADLDPFAYEKLVDRLLASPAYGERWGRHWLDVARYADSNGQEGDQDRPTAYHYRDFVIRAFNEDMPFDQFVRWQLAGDEYEPDNPQAVAATGFVTAGYHTVLDVPMEEEKIRNRLNELDDQLTTTGVAFLGLTLGCARCHDHKFDPVSTRDYYRMLAAFNGGDRAEVPLLTREEAARRRAAEGEWQTRLDAATKALDAWLSPTKQAVAKEVRSRKVDALPITPAEKDLLKSDTKNETTAALTRKYQKELRTADSDYRAAFTDEQQRRWEQLAAAVKSVETARPAPPPTALAQADFGPTPRETWLLDRGDLYLKKERVELGFLTPLVRGRSSADYWSAAKASGTRTDTTYQRRAMADWITDPKHGAGALLARVAVNRMWQHHFDEGLVRTVNDFGKQGETPSHPELLEWLASELVRSGWKLKSLHRLMVTSATYRQATTFDAAKAHVDAENRLLWRRKPRRLEGEAFRDAMLAVSGSLNPTRYGPAFKAPLPPEAIVARNLKTPYPTNLKDGPENHRRSVYMFHKRVVHNPLLQAFDGPDAAASCGRRSVTTVAPQALAVMNEPFVRLRAGEFADRLLREAGQENAAIVDRAYRVALSRPPNPAERDKATAFLEQQTARRVEREKIAPEMSRRLAITDLAHVLFGTNEFIYID
jgi:hypothetical protein